MKFLRQSYPYYHRGCEYLKIGLLILIIGFLFEYLLVPFPRDFTEHLYPYWIISLFHVGVAVVSYLVYFLIFSIFVKEENWKVSSELLAIAGLLLFIGIGEWAIRPVVYLNQSLSLDYLVEEIWHAFLSCGLIYILVVMFNANFLRSKHAKEAMHLKLINKNKQEEEIKVITQNLSDDFMLNPNKLVCARAEGNYLNLYIMQNKIEKSLKRITLQSLCEQLSEIDYIIQTHRGYVVNVNNVKKVKGNAQGFQLSLEGLDFTVPVSRKHLNRFKSLMS